MECREKQPRSDGTGERRPEVDLVRFESIRIAGGLWRHRAVKFVFELTRKRLPFRRED
jgi:hypothetical protein